MGFWLEGKRFFFEKKKQKIFVCWCLRLAPSLAFFVANISFWPASLETNHK